MAVAEAEWLDGFDRDVVLDGWDAVELPGFGVAVGHVLGCGCPLVVTW
jgi:hypothetical protein